MAEGIDYSYGSGLTAAAMKNAGKHFACRYLSPPPNSKNITKAEFDNLRKAGLGVVLVWEVGADRILSGRGGGVADARQADQQASALGAKGIPIYFACDFDAAPGQQGVINDYLRGVASVIGLNRTGLYGSYYVVQRAFNAKVIRFGWQTYAWSGGNWEKRAQLQQYRNGVKLGPADVDLDRSTATDYGQWPRPQAAKPPPPAPKPVPKPAPVQEDDMPNAIQLPETIGQKRTISWATGTAKGITLITDEDGPVVFSYAEFHLKSGTKDDPRWVPKPDITVGSAQGGRVRVNFNTPDDCTAVVLTLKSGQGTTSLHT